MVRTSSVVKIWGNPIKKKVSKSFEDSVFEETDIKLFRFKKLDILKLHLTKNS